MPLSPKPLIFPHPSNLSSHPNLLFCYALFPYRMQHIILKLSVSIAMAFNETMSFLRPEMASDASFYIPPTQNRQV